MKQHLQDSFDIIKHLLSEANKHPRTIDPIEVRDLVYTLEVEVREALIPHCNGCGDPLEEWLTSVDLCSDCFKNMQQKAMTPCHICELLFVPMEPGQALCRACLDSEARDEMLHREEVQRAHAATNGTL